MFSLFRKNRPVFKYAAVPGFERVVDASEKKWEASLVDNAGLDLFGAMPAAVYASFKTRRARIIFNTGLAIAPPQGVHTMIAGRSGLAFKNASIPFYGIIDSSYRGPLKVVLDVDINLLAASGRELQSDEYAKGVHAILEGLFGDAANYNYNILYEHAAEAGIYSPIGVELASYNFSIVHQESKHARPWKLWRYSTFVEHQNYINNILEKKGVVDSITSFPTRTAVAQLVFLNYTGADLTKMKFERVDINDLPESSRGSAGFGSTG